MRIAIPSIGGNRSDKVDSRFGRASYYVIYDVTTDMYSCIDNSAKSEVSGAGGQAVRLLGKNGVDVVLVPEVGPKALQALKAFDMKAFVYENACNVEEAVALYQQGQLKEVLQESHGGYHGNHGSHGLRRV